VTTREEVLAPMALTAEQKEQALAQARAERAMNAVLKHPAWSWTVSRDQHWLLNHSEDRRALGRALAVAVKAHEDLARSALGYYSALFHGSRRHVASDEWAGLLDWARRGQVPPDLASELSRDVPVQIRDPELRLESFPPAVRPWLRTVIKVDLQDSK
jgi:hypothetical protein